MRSKTLRRRTYNAEKRPRHVARPRTAPKCAVKRCDAISKMHTHAATPPWTAHAATPPWTAHAATPPSGRHMQPRHPLDGTCSHATLMIKSSKCAHDLAVIAAEVGKEGVAIAAAELADGCSLLKQFCLLPECRKRHLSEVTKYNFVVEMWHPWVLHFDKTKIINHPKGGSF